MKTRAEERWERMQELLSREAAGHDGPVRISSQRTLFGIKSHVEEVIERVAAEDEQRCLDGMREPDALGPGATNAESSQAEAFNAKIGNAAATNESSNAGTTSAPFDNSDHPQNGKDHHE